MTECEVPATVDNVIVTEEPGAVSEPVLELAGPVDYDSLALKLALGIRNVYQMNDQVAFVLVKPDLREGLIAALNALPDEAYPAQFKEHLGIHADESVEVVRLITQSDVEAMFLEQYFTANGVLPRLQHFLQTNTVRLRVGPVESEMPMPVRISLETLRFMFLWEQKERLAPQIIKPPLGAQIQTSLLRK
jgi:hypothetical protein